MTCEFSQRDDIIIGYVEGTLPPYLRKKFEAHYFLCAECFQSLQRLETIISLLRHEGKTIFAEHGLKKTADFFRQDSCQLPESRLDSDRKDPKCSSG